MASNPQRPLIHRSYTVPLLLQRTAGEPSRPSILSNPPSAIVPPTPPLSNSPGSADSEHTTADAYFSQHMSASAAQGTVPGLVGPPNNGHGSGNNGGGNGSGGGAGGTRIYTPLSPTIASSPTALQTLRSARSNPPGGPSAPMSIQNTPDAYVLSATIGPGFDSSCITIAARKNNVLDIICDRWDMERDCHHEWQVQFDRDADMKGGIHAAYDHGVLTVTVRRFNYTSAARPSVMRR